MAGIGDQPGCEQGQHAQGMVQLGEAAAGEIRSAKALSKQRVAGQDPLILR